MLYGMCINGFEAWKFQNACRWKPNFAQIGGFLYLAAILYLGYHGNGRHFDFCSTPPKAVTYYGGYSYKVDHNMAPKPWISIPNIKIYLETKFRPNWRIFVFWRPFWIQNGHHSKLTMDINLDLGEIWFASRL
jgi:hypothetical protein